MQIISRNGQILLLLQEVRVPLEPCSRQSLTSICISIGLLFGRLEYIDIGSIRKAGECNCSMFDYSLFELTY